MKQYYIKTSPQSKYNAGKARYDCNKVLSEAGYVAIEIGGKSQNGFIHFVQELFSIISLYYRIPKNCIVFLQVPTFNRISMMIYCIVAYRTKHIQVLIHDLQSVRTNSDRSLRDEKFVLSKAEKIIAHTEQMKKMLIGRGFDANKIEVLGIFDYITDSENTEERKWGYNVTFAGNLGKSEFLALLPKYKEIEFHLYGAYSLSIPQAPNIHYEGKFLADRIEGIKGDWGLVWDGNSDKVCAGLLGDYLKLIASHKLSLYIAAEIPVIVWSKSAMSTFVVSEHLGLVVDSISDIKKVIDNITETDKRKIKESLAYYSKLLKQGKIFGSVLEKLKQ